MPDPFVLALGSAIWWFCNHACAGAIAPYGEQILDQLRGSHDAQHNGDLQRALKKAFPIAIDSLRESARSSQERVLWDQVRDTGAEWLEPDSQIYPQELLSALLFDEAGTNGWLTCWDTLKGQLDRLEALPHFERNQGSIERRLRESFGNVLKTKPYQAAATAYQHAMMSQILQSLKSRGDVPPDALSTIEALAAVPDLIAGLSGSVLSVLADQGEAQEEHARETARSLGKAALALDHVRSEMEGRFVAPGGETIACNLLSNCERVRERLLAQPLAGRDDALETLSRMVDDRAHVVVTGPSGSGKSALLAHWVELLKASPDSRVCHHFFSREDDTARLGEGMACLVEQLLTAHQIAGRVSETELGKLKATLRDLLSMSHASRLVVVLDGLDEAFDLEKMGRFAFGPGWFPSELGENVSVVLGVRYGPGLRDAPALAKGLGIPKVDEIPLGNLDVVPISTLLDDDRKDLAEVVAARTGGLAIYVARVVEAVNRAVTLQDAKNLVGQIPANFSEYVNDALGFEASIRPEWRDALGFFAVASGPLSKWELLRLCKDSQSPLHPLVLANPPWEIARWLTRRQDDAWSFQHDTVGDAYRELIDGECETLLQRLLRDCEDWAEHKDPYSLRHYPSDLLRRGDKESHGKLIALALNKEYRAAQREVPPQEPALPLQTIRAAIRVAVETDRLAEMADLMFTYADVVSSHREKSPLEAAQQGDFSRALWLAGLRPPVESTLNLLLVAWHEADRGADENVDAVMSQLVKQPAFEHTVSTRERAYRAIARTVIAHARVLRDDPRFAEWIYPQCTVEDFTTIGAAQAAAGDRLTAHTTFAAARNAVGEKYRSQELVTIASAQAGAGEMVDARATADLIPDDGYRSRALLAIATAQPSTGEMIEALATAADIPVRRLHAEALIAIATTQTSSGDNSAARATLTAAHSVADGIADNCSRAESLCAIATAQAGIGEMTDANTTVTSACSAADNVTNDFRRKKALGAVAASQAATGDKAGAFTTVTTIPAGLPHAWALVAIATAQAGTGAIQNAYTTANDIPDDQHRAEALSAIVKAQVNAGAIADALTTAANIPHDWPPGSTVDPPIRAAVITTVRHSIGWPCIEALVAIASAQANTGDTVAA